MNETRRVDKSASAMQDKASARENRGTDPAEEAPTIQTKVVL